MAGGADAVNVALRLGELMRAHQELLNRMGIAPMWATLLALAHNPPKPAGQVSAELAASEAQAAALQEQLQKQAQRASRYKERARQLEVCTNLSAMPAASISLSLMIRRTDSLDSKKSS